MSRQIKLRAWHMPFGSKGPMQQMFRSQASSVLSFAEMNPDAYIVEQFTGLKDANGKEIYEGDIVKFNGNSDDLAIVKFGEFGVPDASTEEYVDKALGFYFDPKGSLSDIEPFSMTTPVNELYACCTEVIGNVHTDPELLEAQHDTRTD
ncbi:YopX family protein [Lentilactobacillus buchneri]|uniref:YopX family protein n=1 Tax=Lentilactobacillus buchneri TaxID=1581 RepID=UPI001D191AE7|nr:YopX family protein [Lentilactobacillus buchneri]